MVRLAVHLGTVRVDYQAADPTVYMLAVGETLTLVYHRSGGASCTRGSSRPSKPMLETGSPPPWNAWPTMPYGRRSGTRL